MHAQLQPRCGVSGQHPLNLEKTTGLLSSFAGCSANHALTWWNLYWTGLQKSAIAPKVQLYWIALEVQLGKEEK